MHLPVVAAVESRRQPLQSRTPHPVREGCQTFAPNSRFRHPLPTPALPLLLPPPQGLNVVVNQPFGAGAHMSGDRNSGDASGTSARRGVPQGMAGGSGPPMANEGRWTDNGQPLTAAEGRTVLPMLEQVEQAVIARLIPSPQVRIARWCGVQAMSQVCLVVSVPSIAGES